MKKGLHCFLAIGVLIVTLFYAPPVMATGPAIGFNYEWYGELSGWATFEPDQNEEISAGLRYIPVFTFERQLTAAIGLDSEISINAYEIARFDTLKEVDFHGKLKPYRVWLRFSTSQLELRAGLQKISFGSATLLRPLMWFDRIDPRDPLELTDGVYGILGRYYFLNNANIWLWGLVENDDPKGWEADPSDDDRPEFGGRIQLPFYTGEMALSYHHRRARIENAPAPNAFSIESGVTENRIGIDGKWDLGVGVWVEGALVRQNRNDSRSPYRRFMTAGMDYTVAWGNGIHTLIEHFVAASSKRVFGSGDRAVISAGSVSYPIGLLDRLSAIVYYDWEMNDWFWYAAWQRSYDQWNLYLMGFINPSQPLVFTDTDTDTRISGEGIRIMVVYNH